MKILGIETSCDDTCMAIYDSKNDIVLSNYKYNQSNIHMNYNGIVPELASRAHLLYIEKIINKVFLNSGINIYNIDAIAYTAGPGMIGSLLIGATFATSLSFLLNLPIVHVNHIEAHLLSPFIEKNNEIIISNFLGLIISGGHTQLIKVKKLGKYKILGNTLDDSIGDVFDKIANLLNFSYPGGDKISLFANKGNLGRFKFPRPMINHPGFNFSFSGLKTCVTNFINKYKFDVQALYDISKEFEYAIFDSIIIKCIKAIKYTKYKKLIIAGGVSSNIFFRKRISLVMKDYNCKVFFPKLQYCTDNAVMIAYIGYLRFKRKKNFDIFVKPNWSIETLKCFNF